MKWRILILLLAAFVAVTAADADRDGNMVENDEDGEITDPDLHVKEFDPSWWRRRRTHRRRRSGRRRRTRRRLRPRRRRRTRRRLRPRRRRYKRRRSYGR